MRERSISLVLVCFGAALIGCNPSDVLELILPDLQGTWNYQATNPDQATFSNCSGDVANLEGYRLLDKP